MLKFLLRLLGLVLIAAGFVSLVIDGARSIANGAVLATSLGESLGWLFGARYAALQPAIERNLHPLLWDPVMRYVTLAPTALIALVFGFLLLWVGGRRDPGIGRVTRR